MSVRWLKEDDVHPVRPDVPVFRHLTFTEVHALELGLYVGLLAVFVIYNDAGGELVSLLIAIVRFAMSDRKAKSDASKATHRLGFHDVRQEPPYFGAGFLIAFASMVVGINVWSALGLGPLLPQMVANV